MRDHEAHAGGETGEALEDFGLRNVSESLYAGRPAVIVRTTHLHGSSEEQDVEGNQEAQSRRAADHAQESESEQPIQRG